jgi:hypothetical protein
MSWSKILFLTSIALLNTSIYSQTDELSRLNSPLRQIKTMSTTAKYSYGIASTKLNSTNNWSTSPGTNHMAGLGWNYNYKNFVAFDVQVTYELNKFTYKNQGVVAETGHTSLAAELGVKKTFPSKPDDTFFIRGAFGYNFLSKHKEAFSNEFYAHNGSVSTSFYALPELGYQLRLGIKNMIDFSVFYHYGLKPIATTNLFYIDGTNPLKNESAVATSNSRFFGIAIKYHFLFWGSEKSMPPRKAPQEKF